MKSVTQNIRCVIDLLKDCWGPHKMWLRAACGSQGLRITVLECCREIG